MPELRKSVLTFSKLETVECFKYDFATGFWKPIVRGPVGFFRGRVETHSYASTLSELVTKYGSTRPIRLVPK